MYKEFFECMEKWGIIGYLQAARGEVLDRPVWMMRQVGRYMKAYRDLCQKFLVSRAL